VIRHTWSAICSHSHHASNILASARILLATGEDRAFLELIEPVVFADSVGKAGVLSALEPLGWRKDRRNRWRCKLCRPGECRMCQANRKWRKEQEEL
jgi:hypothetical protein